MTDEAIVRRLPLTEYESVALATILTNEVLAGNARSVHFARVILEKLTTLPREKV